MAWTVLNLNPPLYSPWFTEAGSDTVWLEFAHNSAGPSDIRNKRKELKFAKKFADFLQQRPQIRALRIIDSAAAWTNAHLRGLLILTGQRNTGADTRGDTRGDTDQFTLHLDIKLQDLCPKMVAELTSSCSSCPWLSLCTNCAGCQPNLRPKSVKGKDEDEDEATCDERPAWKRTGHTMRRIRRPHSELDLASAQLNHGRNWTKLESFLQIKQTGDHKQYTLAVYPDHQQPAATHQSLLVRPAAVSTRQGHIRIAKTDHAVVWTRTKRDLPAVHIELDLGSTKRHLSRALIKVDDREVAITDSEGSDLGTFGSKELAASRLARVGLQAPYACSVFSRQDRGCPWRKIAGPIDLRWTKTVKAAILCRNIFDVHVSASSDIYIPVPVTAGSCRYLKLILDNARGVRHVHVELFETNRVFEPESELILEQRSKLALIRRGMTDGEPWIFRQPRSADKQFRTWFQNYAGPSHEARDKALDEGLE